MTLRPALKRLGWRSLAARATRMFEQRSPRERVMLTLALGALLWMLADSLWIQPTWQRWQQARARLGAAQARLDQALAEAGQIGTRQLQQQEQLAAEWRQYQARMARGDFDPARQPDTLVPAAEMLPLLERLLAPHPGLRVRSLQSLGSTQAGADGRFSPNSSVIAPAAPPASAASASSTTPQAPVWRHGVELTLEGPYPELLACLQALENAPQKLLWGRLQLQVEQHPRVLLTVRLYTLSLEPAWVEIRS